MSSEQAILGLLEEVKDPEIPSLSVLDMGIVRRVEVLDEVDGDLGDRNISGRDVTGCNITVIVTITPTYSGCPAMQTIEDDILLTLQENGYPKAEVRSVLSPPWTSDWLSERARAKLKESGIAPPCQLQSANTQAGQSLGSGQALVTLGAPTSVCCPYCNSEKTALISEFGTTACKALYSCKGCGQPFDYFKAI